MLWKVTELVLSDVPKVEVLVSRFRYCVAAVAIISSVLGLSANAEPEASKEIANQSTRHERCALGIGTMAKSDYEGRCPVRKYRALVSENDKVCDAVIAAWNKAPAGPLELYSSSLFIPWQELEPGDPSVAKLSRKPPNLQTLYDRKWLIADVFNDGTRWLVEKTINAPGSRAPSDAISLFGGTIPEGSDWTVLGQVDRELKQVFGQADPISLHTWMSGYGSANGEKRVPIGFPKLPSEARARKPWKDLQRGNYVEINFVALDGKVYVVHRELNGDIGVVLRFGADKQGNDLCYIEPISPGGR